MKNLLELTEALINISDYQGAAELFLLHTNTKINIKFKEYGKHFADDKQNRNIYKCTLKNKNGSYSFAFGDSIHSTNNGTEPREYDILSCLSVYNNSSFQDFCDCFGYDTDSRKAEKIYKAVCKQEKALKRLFSADELEALIAIQ